MKRNVRATIAAGCLALGLLAGGCATGEYRYVVRTSPGERLEFPLVKGAPEPAKQGTIEISHAGLLPVPDANAKEVMYLFSFTEANGVAPKSVRIDDVSGETTIPLHEDNAPKLEGNRWSVMSKRYKGEDPEMAWLGQLGDTMRVFRFTIVTADNREVVLHQGWMVPGWMKAGMRRTLDLPPL